MRKIAILLIVALATSQSAKADQYTAKALLILADASQIEITVKSPKQVVDVKVERPGEISLEPNTDRLREVIREVLKENAAAAAAPTVSASTAIASAVPTVSASSATFNAGVTYGTPIYTTLPPTFGDCPGGICPPGTICGPGGCSIACGPGGCGVACGPGGCSPGMSCGPGGCSPAMSFGNPGMSFGGRRMGFSRCGPGGCH